MKKQNNISKNENIHPYSKLKSNKIIKIEKDDKLKSIKDYNSFIDYKEDLRLKRDNKLEVKDKKKIKIDIFDIVCLIMAIIVWTFVITSILTRERDYYFSYADEDLTLKKESEEDTEEKEENKENNNQQSSNNSNNKPNNSSSTNNKPNNGQQNNNSGVTSVVYDNQYFRQVPFTNINDVYNLIREDSLKQKNACPKEIVQIENEIINNYGIIAVNFCEINLTMANELKNIVAYIMNNFPQVKTYLTNITIGNVTNANYIAAFMPIFTFATSDTANNYPMGTKTQIILNAKYFLNSNLLRNTVNYSVRTGYYPQGASSSSTVAHEFGHFLSYVALLNNYNSEKLNFIPSNNAKLVYTIYDDFNAGNYSYTILQEAYEKYQTLYGTSLSFDDFRKSISLYAVAKNSSGNYIYDETIAEAFHDCYLNGDNAKAASKIIMEVLKSKI